MAIMNFEISQQLKKEEELLKLNKKSKLIEELMKYKSRAAFSQANIERYQRTASFTFYELTADYEEELHALANATCSVEDIQTFSNDYGHSVIIKFVCRTHSDAELLFETIADQSLNSDILYCHSAVEFSSRSLK
jgi:hypothetical protein